MTFSFLGMTLTFDIGTIIALVVFFLPPLIFIGWIIYLIRTTHTYGSN